MAQLQQLLLGLVVVLFVATGMMQILAFATIAGGYTAVSFPLAGKIQQYSNQTTQFSQTLANSTEATMKTPSVIDPLTGFSTLTTAGAQAVGLTFSSLGIMVDIITMSATTLTTMFGVPMWMFGFGILFISILVTLVILGAVFKWFV